MPTNFKPSNAFAPEIGQSFDSDIFFMPWASLDSSVLHVGDSDIPRGVFSYGDLSSAGGSATSTKTAGISAPPAPITVTTAGSGLAVHITWESSVASAPSAFTAGVIAAVTAFETKFTNAVTIDIAIGYGTIANTAMSAGALGESESYLQYVSYASLRSVLSSHNTDATDASVLASLPATAPVGGYLWVTTAQAKALGLAAPGGTGLDGYIGLASNYAFSYGGNVASGTYDFNGVVAHELTEVMGRLMLTGGSIGPYAHSYSLLDLLHYSAPGVRDFASSVPGYFSIDGGVTNGGAFNTVSGGDAADWASSMGSNSYNAFSNAGIANVVSSGDIAEMNAIGWTLTTSSTPSTPSPAPSPPPAPGPVPTPPGAVAIASVGNALAATQGTTGLQANTSLATLTAVGGTAGNPIAYTLGGTGAGSFAKFANRNNTATLSTGAAGVLGRTNGAVYALTLSATDTTTGLSSTPSAFGVVVASGGNDVVPLAALVGAASKVAPTFIYGLGGNDTLNGAGMTGKLWLDGGAGADTMTGGSGPNRYLYNAKTDSTASAMDIVTNFSASKDFIDLTGIGSTALTFVGGIFGNKLAAGSVGFQISGFNTFVYVNTSGAAEALAAADMKIDLNGWQLIGANNILHN
jgi:hypothetical protein